MKQFRASQGTAKRLLALLHYNHYIFNIKTYFDQSGCTTNIMRDITYPLVPSQDTSICSLSETFVAPFV